MSMKLNALSCLLAAVISTGAWAEKAAIFPVRATNVPPGQVEVIGAIFAARYAQDAKVATLSPNEITINSEESPALAATRLGVDRYITVEALGIGSKIRLIVTLHDATGASVQVAEGTALEPEELDTVVERLSLALANRVSVENTQNIGNVTLSEAAPPVKAGSNRSIGFKTNFSGVLGTEQTFGLATLMFDMRVEMRRVFLEFGAGALIPMIGNSDSKYGGLQLDVGANVFVNPQDNNGFYLGGGIMPRLVISDSAGATVLPYLQAGFTTNRQGRARFFAEARVAQNIIALTRNTYDYNTGANKTEKSMPTEVGLGVGMGF